MRIVTLGLAIIFSGALAGMAYAASPDAIQDEEQPGSEIEIEADNGKIEAGREDDMAPVEGEEMLGGGDAIDVPPDPAFPDAGDPIDDALPGEGPENLSGPGDEDQLPE